MTRLRWSLLFASFPLLAACAGTQQVQRPSPVQDKNYEQEAADPKKVQQLRIEVIRGLLDKEQYYAALANVEELRRQGETPELTLLEAEARRHLGQREPASALYRKLIGSPYEGQAYHGLGLLQAATDIEAAIQNLRRAAMLSPTDVEIRNDLGYALMAIGRYSEALPELSTAAELAPMQVKIRNNLIILMLLTGNKAGLAQLTQQAGTTPEILKQLRDQAQGIRNEQAGRTKRAPAG